jgi:general secretion pathway protein D
MTRFTRVAAFLLIFAAAIAAAADKAKSIYNKGEDAEARQKYEEAYDDYKQAYSINPKNLRYRASYERLRFLAGAAHVHRGQLLREAGKLEDSLAEFEKAAEIDPSSFIARQEIQQTKRLMELAKSPGPSANAAPGTPKRYESAQGPVELAPIDNPPINLVETEDSKKIYETIGRLAGLNVLFDPDYTSRVISAHLNNITLLQALEIVEMESKTFWRPVTPNTIFVAQDTPAKRKEIEQSVVKTFYLANLSQQTELQDVVNALRQILEISRIQPIASQDAIVVRGTPDQIALAEKLVNDLDKARSEVVVDVAILQVSRDKARTLGINPPTSATVTLQNNINTTTTTTGTTAGTGTVNNGTSGTPNTINLNRLGNLNATDFTVNIPSATASALFSDSDTRLLQNPQIRSVDGQKASLKIGEKIPIAQGSFQPGIGGVGINPLVNTQFQYLDVGVNIDITPRIHAGGEVSMKITMDVSSVTGSSNLGGINQPIIGRKTMEHEIRLRDGEVSLLGGMLEDQNNRTLTGIPGLSQIPILKYLFSQTQTDHSENEIVFVLIPHIVREPEVSDLNEKALAVGTATAIQLSRISPVALPGHSSAATAPAPADQTPGRAPVTAAPSSPAPAVSPVAAPTSAPASGTSASFAFEPSNITQPSGSTFAVNVMLGGAQNVYSVPLQVSYDPKLLQVVNVSNGSFLSQDGQAVALVHRDDDASGTLQITATRPPGANGVSGQGSVVTLTFMAKTSGQGSITISKGGARDPGLQPVPVSGAVATVTVH